MYANKLHVTTYEQCHSNNNTDKMQVQSIVSTLKFLKLIFQIQSKLLAFNWKLRIYSKTSPMLNRMSSEFTSSKKK